MKPIYLDYNATSPLRPEVLEAMKPFFTETFGNPSSFHQIGQKSRHVLEEARKTLLSFIGKRDGQIIFTSSATEANNLAIFGSRAKHLVSSAIEHLSVLMPLEVLKKQGAAVELAMPDENGIVSVTAIEKILRPETRLVSLMAANNETGVLQPVHELGTLLRSRGILFHVDAVQVFGRMKFDFASLEADFITFSAHKIGGPKGIGALWIREGLKIDPILSGGHHENNLRAGTENLPAIIGFVKTAEIAFQNLDREERRLKELRDKLESGILSAIPNAFINGQKSPRIPNTLNLSIPGLETESLLILLDSNGISASAGSACTSGAIDVSYVLKAMNLPEDRLRSAIRLSLGYGTASEEIDRVLKHFPAWIAQLRGNPS